MFDPAGAGIDLPVLALRLGDDPAADCRMTIKRVLVVP